jgi:hypothetical protein
MKTQLLCLQSTLQLKIEKGKLVIVTEVVIKYLNSPEYNRGFTILLFILYR